MACDDDYVVDAGGNRILIGLTADETREFERLDDLISELGPAGTDDIQSLNERRWLILYDKHQSSVKIFISIQNAMAFRKSRTAQALTTRGLVLVAMAFLPIRQLPPCGTLWA